MTILRVYLADPPDAERGAAWALFDVAGRVVRSGSGRPAEWPGAERSEAIVAARNGRLVALKLPPLPGARAAAAVRYALEDQLADAPDDSHLAQSAQRPDGTVRVAIVGHAWMREFAAASRRLGLRWHRAVLECDLVQPPAGTWYWCVESITQSGFVVTDHGASIEVGPARDDAIPSELAVALAAADAPRLVRVDAAGATPALLIRWREQSGREFSGGTPWRWYDAKPAAIGAAIDLLTGPYDDAPEGSRPVLSELFRPALIVALAAIGVYALASTGQWVWLRWQSAAMEREMQTLAHSVAPEAGDVPPRLAIARREAELRHRAGLAADDDLLPLLARAAPALGALPAGTVRSINYADGHLVLELLKTDAARASTLQQELQRLGLTAIAVSTASGARVRIGFN